MTIAQFYRISGLGMLTGALAFILHIVLRSLATAGVDPVAFAQQGLWIPINLLGGAGAALVLLGLPVLYARLASATGWLGLLGIVLIALALIFFGLFLSLYSILIVPWLAAQAPELVAADAPLPAAFLVSYVTALVIELVGCILLAIPFIRGHVQPRWIGYLLPGAAIWTAVGVLLAPSGPAVNLAINLLSNMGPVLLMIGFGYLGTRMWSTETPVRQEKLSMRREQGLGQRAENDRVGSPQT